MIDAAAMRSRLTTYVLTLALIAACDAKPAPAADPAKTADVPAEPVTPAVPTTPAIPSPSADNPTPTTSPVFAAAEAVRQWAAANQHGGNLPEQLFRPTSPLTLAIEIDACDGTADECISRLDLPDAAAFEAWLTDNVGELPGMDVATKIESCNDANCCTFANLGREASKEGGMVPHELMELRSVCFDVDQQTVLGVRRLKFVNW